MRVGVDTGGTFTDLVAVDGAGALHFVKLPSTPEDPARAVLEGIARLAAPARAVCHGTTVATNALIERRGAKTAFVTTAGFEDLLELGRQARPELYALEPELPEPLVPDELRFGADERLGPRGEIERALTAREVERVAEAAAQAGAAAAAVVLLHAYADGRHERMLGEALARRGVRPSLSCEVLPEHREYERASTTLADAYVGEVVAAYLGRLEQALAASGARLAVMQSSGGAAGAAEARRRPVCTLLSGPAAGVVGARAAAERAGIGAHISFDMGGTSTDAALAWGPLELSAEGSVAGLPVAVPALPVHTVGAGGGSIARCDAGGALKVGPGSAGARPGPACYGLGGDLPTVTDAALVLGRIDPGRFLGDGARRLDLAHAEAAIDRLAEALGVGRAVAAAGIARVAVQRMAGAIRTVSVERGRDPRGLALVAFGGAGGLFACEVAEALEMARVLIPPAPGLLCAYGALRADTARDFAATRLCDAGERLGLADLAAELAPLEQAARAALDEEQVAPERRRIDRRVDLRYRGQSYELSVPLAEGRDALADFRAMHQERFGFADAARPIERVAVRVHARGAPEPAPPLTVPIAGGDPRIGEGVLDRARLAPGAALDGPCRIVELSATTFVAPGWRATVDGDGAMHLARR